MADTPKAHQITLEAAAETLEQITLLAEREGASVSEMAGKLLADEAEARADTWPVSSKVHASVTVAV
jgi:hypothetical protein